MSSKIIIVPYIDLELKKQGEYCKFISHGIDADTLRNIPLPSERYDVFIEEDCIFDYEIREYILKDYSQ